MVVWRGTSYWPPQHRTLPLNTNVSLVLSASSITCSSSVPCEQKLAWNKLSGPALCPIFLDLSYFFGEQSILFLAKGDYHLSVRTWTSWFLVETWKGTFILLIRVWLTQGKIVYWYWKGALIKGILFHLTSSFKACALCSGSDSYIIISKESQAGEEAWRLKYWFWQPCPWSGCGLDTIVVTCLFGHSVFI